MEEALIKRIMPNNLEAEQSVIGAMIMDREAVIVASRDIGPCGFLSSAVWNYF